MFPVIAKIAEVVKEVAATSVEEMHISEAVMQDMKEGLAQAREAEASMSNMSTMDGMKQLEANSKYIKDGQLYTTDSNGVAKLVEGEVKKDAVASEVQKASAETAEKTAESTAEIKNQLNEAIDQYKKELKENSPYPDTLDLDKIDLDKVEKALTERVREMRDWFNKHKGELISEWEKRTGKEWPRYTEDVIKDGVVIRKAGDLYDAHHIKPLSWGGENIASNITPMEWGPHQLIHGKYSGFKTASDIIKNMV